MALPFKIKKIFQILGLGLLIWPLCAHAENNELLNLDLTDLMQIQITSAGRKEQSLSDVPAAVYVITAEDIATSAATSLPELLRMVPGLQVARIGSSKWAVASRGFNGTFSSELLVQIDGRSVYTPAFSGVYWDMQTVMLEEIERIEVIRGPGATLWGANAVNGIINIITKAASDSTGIYASTASGNLEQAAGSLRYGQQFGTSIYGKGYFEFHKRSDFSYAPSDKAEINAENDANDSWEMLNGGFRFDGDISLKQSWTLQGDIYSGEENQQTYAYWDETVAAQSLRDDVIKVNGYNILGRWQQHVSETGEWALQAYYDYSERKESYIDQSYKTFDIDLQHRFQLFDRNDIVWGLGYRNIEDEFNGSNILTIDPARETVDLYSAFVQDEISLIRDRLLLTLGTKYEHNDYTDEELQPSVRLLWKPTKNQSVWTSVSKAVRTPSRFETAISVVMSRYEFPPFVIPVYMQGNNEFGSENVIAYEAGYRLGLNENFTFDLTLFHNEYKDLREYYFTSTGSQVDNGGKGSSNGLEMAFEWKPTGWLKTALNYSYIDLDITSDSIALDPRYSTNATVLSYSSPKHQVSLRTGISLLENLQLNLFGRYVDEIKQSSPSTASGVDAYFALDASILWQVNENLSLKIAGQNLTDPEHLEFVNEYFTQPTEVGRSVYAQLNFKY